MNPDFSRALSGRCGYLHRAISLQEALYDQNTPNSFQFEVWGIFNPTTNQAPFLYEPIMNV